jgi:hypothetical protein
MNLQADVAEAIVRVHIDRADDCNYPIDENAGFRFHHTSVLRSVWGDDDAEECVCECGNDISDPEDPEELDDPEDYGGRGRGRDACDCCTSQKKSPTKEIATLTGLLNRRAQIGTFHNLMYSVYAENYYALGSYFNLSDARYKTNVRELPSITERIAKLRPVAYDFVRDGSGRDVSKDPAYKNRVGFIAQEVEELFPDLVAINTSGEGEDAEEVFSLNYVGLIPYLTQAIQEQNRIIENLQRQINEIQYGHLGSFDVIDNMSNRAPQQQSPQAAAIAAANETHVLHQNVPNPFNSTTTITYQLAEGTTNAKICIYNLTGKQLQCYTLPSTWRAGSIEIRASSLQPGMYLYSLIVDGKLIDTKRMILTE